MRKALLLVLTIVTGLMLPACDDESQGAGAETATSDREGGPVGVWERRYRDAVGQNYLDVLELRPDGGYVTHMQGAAPSDKGRYEIEGDVIGFRSAVDPRYSQDVRFSLEDETTLRLTVNTPVPLQIDWQRSALRPNFGTVEMDGRAVPRGLPGLMMSALVSEARPWRNDALPTWIRVEEEGRGGAYRLSLHFFAPSSREGMLIRLSAFDIKRSVNDGARTVTAPLPPDFLDLPESLAAAKASGIGGTLKKADVRVHGAYGPVWFVATTGPRGANISAVTGERINADVTGYVAQYEADWNRAGELWRKAMERYRPKQEEKEGFWSRDHSSYTNRQSCVTSGGTWMTSGGGWCH